MTKPSSYVLDAISSQAFARLEQAAHEAATSPWNTRREPSEAQKQANNYFKGRFLLRPGLPVKIDNPRGTVRSGKSPDGTEWSNRMAAHYGDFTGTKGADGDAVDVFIGGFPESERVWVINQRRTWGDHGFDEHKVMAGFLNEDQARNAYLGSYDAGWDGLESIVPCNYGQLMWWLRYGDCTAPFTIDNLPHEGTIIMDKAVAWDADANPVGIPMHQLVYDLRRADGAGLLLDAVTMEDLMSDPDIEQVMTMDALVVQVNRMTLKMDMLLKIMQGSGTDVKPTDYTISDPIRARGVLQVMVIFQMDDGQTIAIWFHNPDTTPAKLTPMDELVSWKWMLNKRDVTIVVAPERGKELNIREVARRIMRLVQRNSAAFARANQKAAERVKQIEELRTEVTSLEVELSDYQRRIEIAQMQRDEAPTPKERWDAARGYANSVSKEVRAELIDAPMIKDAAALAEVTSMMSALKDLAAGTTQVDSPEALRAKVDELAVAIRANAQEAAQAPEPAAAPAEQPVDSNVAVGHDVVLSRLGVSPEDIGAMAEDGGYAAIVADDKLSLKWQDVLDSALQQRMVDVRNALREIGWKGAGSLSKDIDGSVHGIEADVRGVGAGKNVVQVFWVLDQHTRVTDDLTLKAADMASHLEATLRVQIANATAAAAEPVEAAAAAPAVDDLGPLPEGWTQGPGGIATNPDPVKGGIVDKQIASGQWFVIYNNDAIPKDETTYATRAEAFAAFQAAQELAARSADAAAAAETPKSPTDAELESAAKAGAEVKSVARNLADPATKDLVPRATLQTDDRSVSVALWTDEDVTRAVKAVADAESMSHFKPFDPSTLKMPSAVQLGIAKSHVLVLPVSDADDKIVLDGWSNGHMMDFTQRPPIVEKAIVKYFGEDTSVFIRHYPWSKIEKLEIAAKGRGTQVEPISHYDYEQTIIDNTKIKKGGSNYERVPVNSIVLSNADGSVWVWLDAKYVGYFWKLYKGCDFFADSPDLSVAVRKNGKLVGVIMPMGAKGDTSILARARRAKAQTEVQQQDPGELTPAVVDAAYVFADATDAFKIAVAHSVNDPDYSAFKSARDIDERAKALGLSVSWDVRSMVLDAVPLPGFEPEDTASMFDGRRERVLDAIAEAAQPYLAHGAALDDAVPALQDATLPTSWLDFKLVDQAYVDQAGATALPSASQPSEPVWIGLTSGDGGMLYVAGRIVGVSFTASKVRYSVAVPIAPQPREGVTLYAVVHGVDSELVQPIQQSPEAAVMDAVSEDVMVRLQPHVSAKPPVPELVFTGDKAVGRVVLKAVLDAATAAGADARQFANALHMLDDASEQGGGEEWETVVGDIKKDGEVIGRAVVMDGDGKCMIFLGAAGTQRVTYVSPVDGERRSAMWSDDDAGQMVDWLVENIATAQAQAQAAIEAAAAPAPEPAPEATTGGGEPPAEPPAPPPVDAQPEPRREDVYATEAQGRAALQELSNFMPVAERRAIETGMRGEEKQYFFDLMVRLRELIWRMPKVYEQDGKGGAAIAYLHYFRGGADWYITERDYDMEDQAQAFGMVDLGHGPELGYISIDEITRAGAELDLHWTPKTIGEIRGEQAGDENDGNIGRRWRSPSGTMEVTGFKDGRYTTQVDGERPGLPVAPDDLEETIRDDERAVAEAEAETRAQRDADGAAGGAELEAAGFKRIGGAGFEYAKSVDNGENAVRNFNVKRVGGSGYPEGWKVTMWVTFKNGITGAPSQDLGMFKTAGEALAAVNERMPAVGKPSEPGSSDGENAPMIADTSTAGADPAANAERDADAAWLQSIIDGTADMMDPGILERIEPMFGKYSGDAAMGELLTKAANAYSDAAAAAAKKALGG